MKVITETSYQLTEEEIKEAVRLYAEQKTGKQVGNIHLDADVSGEYVVFNYTATFSDKREEKIV